MLDKDVMYERIYLESIGLINQLRMSLIIGHKIGKII